MNIILFEDHEIGKPLPRTDARAEHILRVLRRQIGSSTDVGRVNGPRGKAILQSVQTEHLILDFAWHETPLPLQPVDLVVGLSRPQTCRKILQEATSLGVRRMFFVQTDRGEPSYATSKLWTTGQWQRLVRTGVEQAFTTRIPQVHFDLPIEQAVDRVASADALICLDNYEATHGLASAVGSASSVVIALGSERGWTGRERNLFRSHGFTLASLGQRPLRTETATVAATSIAMSLLDAKAEN